MDTFTADQKDRLLKGLDARIPGWESISRDNHGFRVVVPGTLVAASWPALKGLGRK
jgi:hypothetical protein